MKTVIVVLLITEFHKQRKWNSSLLKITQQKETLTKFKLAMIEKPRISKALYLHQENLFLLVKI